MGAWINAALAAHGRKLGPDPASIQAAEIGGIVANNASGRCCGIHHNNYRTIDELDLVLADGFHLRTSDDDRLARERVRADTALTARIRRAFATKNTVGYSLNAFLNNALPARILQKLVVGSEGTLAFIASATFRTMPVPRHRAVAWQMMDLWTGCAGKSRRETRGASPPHRKE